MWPHAIHNCVPVGIIPPRDVSNSSITLAWKGHTRLFSRFRLVSNQIRPACVAPHVIETEKRSVPTTDYQVPSTQFLFERSEFLIATSRKKTLCVCRVSCVRLIILVSRGSLKRYCYNVPHVLCTRYVCTWYHVRSIAW